MKSTTFYRLVLGLPYVVLIPGFFAMRDYFRPMFTEAPDPSSGGWLGLIGAFWGVTGIFWIIPYTLFAIGLLLWSIGRSKETIRTWFARSPFILMMLSPLFFLALLPFHFTDENSAGAFSAYVIIGIVCSAPFSLIFGFIFVGIGLLIHSILTSLSLIKDETSMV